MPAKICTRVYTLAVMSDEPNRGGEPPRQTIGVRDLRAQLAAHLARVERGEVVIITSGGRPVARLSPVSEPPAEKGYGLEDMARLGLVERPRLEPVSGATDPGSSGLTTRPLPVDVRVDRVVRQVRG